MRFFSVLLALTGLLLPCTLAQSAEDYLKSGIVLRYSGRDSLSLVLINKAINLEPNQAVSYYQKGKTLQKLKRIEEAYDAFKTADKLQPQNPDFIYELGYTSIDLQKLRQAIAHFEEAIEALKINKQGSDSLKAMCLYEIGFANYDLGDPATAEKYYRKAIPLRPNYPKYNLELGLSLYSQEKYEEAIKELNNSIRIKNKEFAKLHYLSRYYLSLCYYELKKYKDALKEINLSLTLEPNSFISLLQRGVTLLKLDDKKAACVCFTRAQQMGSEDAKELLNKYCQ
jgi:tetratricopeptide (TPR) repeat protein